MHLRLVVAVALLSCASLARAQSGGMGLSAGPNGFNMNFNMNDAQQQPQGQMQVQMQTTASAHEEFSSSKPGETYKITYDSDPAGQTRFKILAPEGLGVRVSDNGNELLRDAVPAAFNATPGHFYRVEIFTNQAVLFDKKFEAKPGMLAQLWITASAPAQQVSVVVQQPQPAQVVYVQAPQPQQQVVVASAPACIGASDLGGIREAIGEESFSDAKLQVLGTAVEGRSFCVAQVIELIGSFDFSSDKLKALKMMAPHIADRQNNFKIYGAFDFDSDKQQAKAILR